MPCGEKTCAFSSQAWGAYQSSQSEELEALSHTVGLLSEETFRRTLSKATAVVPKALSLIQTSDVVDLALRGQQQGMEEVLGHVRELEEVLEQEQVADEQRRRYCERELGEAKQGKQGRERDVEDVKSILASFEACLGPE